MKNIVILVARHKILFRAESSNFCRSDTVSKIYNNNSFSKI